MDYGETPIRVETDEDGHFSNTWDLAQWMKANAANSVGDSPLPPADVFNAVAEALTLMAYDGMLETEEGE